MALPTASVVSSGLAGYPTIFYDRVGLRTLQSNLFFYPACNLRTMPDRSGVALQLFSYTAMAANVTPVTEGTPGSGQALTQNIGTINLANYADYISLSSKVKLTAISPQTEDAAQLIAYRGALSIDTVIQTAVTTQAATNTAVDEIAAATFIASVARHGVWSLRGKNVKPYRDTGVFFGITHPLTAFDLVNDATSAGFTDLQKFSDRLASDNPALAGIKGAYIGNVGGADFWESAACTITAAGSPAVNTYNSYIFGDEAIMASSLGKTDLGDKNFSVKVMEFPMGSNSLDPCGLIAGAAAYSAWFGCVTAPVPTNSDKFRVIQTGSSIG
jgi:N4-gp56 family major capsid protein